MAEKDLEMRRMNTDATYTIYNPLTKAANVKMNDGTSVETKVMGHLADYATHKADYATHKADYATFKGSKGQPNGLAPLDENGNIPEEQMQEVALTYMFLNLW